jgi:hypothetical protein
MDKQERALNALAVMRDQKVVFGTVRAIVNDLSLTPEEAMTRISELYVAYDESHPQQQTAG